MYTTSTSQKIPAEWRNEDMQKPPRQAVYVHESNAADILKNAHTQATTAWTGDLHNARQVLAVMKKRTHRPSGKIKNAPAGIQTAFHAHRMKQAQQSRVLSMLIVRVGTGFQLGNPRVPDACVALADVYVESSGALFLLPLNQLLGFIGAYEWHKKGIDIPQPGGKIHIPFGVLSPLCGEYLDLVAQVLLNPHIQTTFDIGTSSSVIAAILAKHDISRITAIGTNPKAITCATANLARLGLGKQVAVQTVDLFLEGRANLIVCNPPWSSVKPTSAVKTALYDPDNAILTTFLSGVRRHLNPQSEAWLIISDLTEHLHLRGHDSLEQCFQTASLGVVGILETKPHHRKAVDESGPLTFARNRETARLYRLEAVR